MVKQDAKDRFQADMDIMVREALGLPEETEQETLHREKAAKIRADVIANAEKLDAKGTDEEE